MAQSDTHTNETTAMRAFDAGFQKVSELGPRARIRILTYIAGRLEDERSQALSETGMANYGGTGSPVIRDHRGGGAGGAVGEVSASGGDGAAVPGSAGGGAAH